jgi:hypothetical protein
MENGMIRTFTIGALAAALAAMSPLAVAQTQQHGGSTSLQGDTKAWSDNAHMHAFYDLTRQTLGKGAPALDFEGYREKSYAIFRAFGVSMGMSAEGMVDHLKDIPAQLVDIVKDDPEVLDSYDNFKVALMGPE